MKISLSALVLLFSFFLLLFSQDNGKKEITSFLKEMDDDDSKYTTTGNLGITITNYGTFGDGFTEQSPVDQPSGEYPRGSGIEHLFVGGLWVGAQTSSGTKVSTGAFNVPRLSGVNANFEYTNTDDPTDLVIERSSIEQNKYFAYDAVSHQDFVCDFSDTNLYVPGTSIQIPFHEPMGIAVHLETYAWNYPFADAFVIFNYTIKNVWQDTLKDVYVGLWADLVVRNTNLSPPRIGSPFYLYAGVGYTDNDSIKMVYAYDADSPDRGFSNSYMAMSLLGADPVRVDQTYSGDITRNWWLFSGSDPNPQNQPPTDEVSRYDRMANSMEDNFYNSSIYQDANNRMSLISTGPFDVIPPDSSINVVFSMSAGKEYGTDNDNPNTRDSERVKKNLYDNTNWAYRAYHGEDTNRNGVLDYLGTDSTEDVLPNGKLDRYILPTPPAPPNLKAVLGSKKVTLYWDRRSEESIDLISKLKDFEGFRIYRSNTGDDRTGSGLLGNLELFREFDNENGLFYDTGLEEILMDEPITDIVVDPETQLMDTIVYTYKLEIDNLHNGWQYAFSVSAFDSGDAKLNLPSLESSRLQNAVIISPGTPPMAKEGDRKIGVYPNPYRANALWDGNFERERKIYFFNLPAKCQIRIYTLAGDMVDQFDHNGAEYSGTDIKWFQEFSSSETPTQFAGGEHAWDLVTRDDQAIATGLYLFTVKDLETNEVFKGKFVVIK